MAVARLGAIALDSDDPIRLGRFYSELLDLTTIFESEELVVLRAGGVAITVERVLDHQPPDWPDSTIPKQLHLDLLVDDLDESEQAAIALGARKPEAQPAPGKWRVLPDPAGHPFCLTVPPSA
ncbi:VOC family protein [Nocardia sp. CDC160]|uniref:VOC family protein n=1 Tax=Nocardia sp. CDC160 TaxID=3112166 RepID=UPI002DBB3214|nr:VOC family protein [Nocardia sp. CDC160]MEC3915964.1 VOC family protein [Nocardia sp. CDC160]